MNWPDVGQRYQGDLLNGLPHGEGTMIYGDGSRYVGQWEKGVRVGIGKLKYADGRVYEGLFPRMNRLARFLARNELKQQLPAPTR